MQRVTRQFLLLLLLHEPQIKPPYSTTTSTTQSDIDRYISLTTPNMPLVVPGVTSQSGDKTEEWTNKLVGKKIHDGEDSNETVSLQKDP